MSLRPEGNYGLSPDSFVVDGAELLGIEVEEDSSVYWEHWVSLRPDGSQDVAIEFDYACTLEIEERSRPWCCEDWESLQSSRLRGLIPLDWIQSGPYNTYSLELEFVTAD
jgi:hypothetical protein